MRILAVDDDPIILNILAGSLKLFNFDDVTFSASAEDALDVIEEARQPFDICLFDVMLPGISGVELCRQVRAMDQYRTAPIIMITANRESDIMERAFGAGATDFVSKPFDGLELGTRINLAVMLSASLRREKQMRHEMSDLTKLTAVTFDEAFNVHSGAFAMGLIGLENELLRRPDALYAMTLFCVMIEDAAELFRDSTPSYFRQIIEAVGASLSRVFSPQTTKFSYAGKGRFVVVTNGRKPPHLDDLRDAAERSLSDAWSPAVTGRLTAPALNFAKIDDRKIMSGRSAATAINQFLGQSPHYESVVTSDIVDR